MEIGRAKNRKLKRDYMFAFRAGSVWNNPYTGLPSDLDKNGKYVVAFTAVYNSNLFRCVTIQSYLSYSLQTTERAARMLFKSSCNLAHGRSPSIDDMEYIPGGPLVDFA